jgi:hypothetical protein
MHRVIMRAVSPCAQDQVEKADIAMVVREFQRFLETPPNGDGTNQTTILELK